MAIVLSAKTESKLRDRADRESRDPDSLAESIVSAYLSGEWAILEPEPPAPRRAPQLPPPDVEYLRKRVVGTLEEAGRRDPYGVSDEIEVRIDKLFAAEIVGRLESGQFQDALIALEAMTDELAQEAYEHSQVEDLSHMFHDIASLWTRVLTESGTAISADALQAAHRHLVASADYLGHNYGGKGPFDEAVALLAKTGS